MPDWRHLLLRSPSFAAHLLPAKAGVSRDTSSARELYDFLERLGRADRALVATGLDLVTGGYGDFLEKNLPPILDSLAVGSESELKEVGPALVGHPEWTRTFLGWSSGSLMPGRYISRVRQSSFDLPENAAVKLLIDRLQSTAGRFVRMMRDSVHPEIRRVALLAEHAQRHRSYSHLVAPEAPSEQLIRAAEGAKAMPYRAAGRLLRRRTCLSQVDDLAYWRQAALKVGIENEVFVPVADEDVFELLALATTLDILEHSLALGSPISFWMRIGTRSTAGPVARFLGSRGDTFEVYFNRTPAFLLDDQTVYAKVFDTHHGLGRGADRRPDIVIVHEPPGTERRNILFIEAKLPGDEDPGSYLRQSIYKAFGYLYDFAGLWNTDQKLRIVLFVPNEAEPKSSAFDGGAGGLAVISASHPELLAEAIKAALNS